MSPREALSPLLACWFTPSQAAAVHKENQFACRPESRALEETNQGKLLTVQKELPALCTGQDEVFEACGRSDMLPTI